MNPTETTIGNGSKVTIGLIVVAVPVFFFIATVWADTRDNSRSIEKIQSQREVKETEDKAFREKVVTSLTRIQTKMGIHDDN